MSTNALYSRPPTTSDTLDTTSRTRLLKTARKVGAILGQTPLVLATTPATIGPAALSLKLSPSRSTAAMAATKRQRRQGSIFEVPVWCDDARSRSSIDSVSSAASSMSSGPNASSSLVHLPLLDHTSSCTSASESEYDAALRPRGLAALRARAAGRKPAPAPLHLHLMHPAPSDDDEPLSYPRAPLSPLAATPTVPSTPPTARPIDARVRKMAKLARHLGERIPQELVFPSSDEELLDTSGMTSYPALSARALARHGTVSGVVVHRAAETVIAPAETTRRPRAARRRSSSYSAAPSPFSSLCPPGGTSAVVAAARFASVQNVAGGARAYPSVVRAPAVEPRKGEEVAGWVGQWNRDDMRDVRNGLRALRVR